MWTVILAICLIFCSVSSLYAVTPQELDEAVNATATNIYKTVKDPQVGSLGGEWAVLGLARSSFDVPDSYYEGYYKTVEEYVKACQGILHEKKYTEYSRVILGLTAAGYDPRNVAGYDLTLPLADFDHTIEQGINGPIWALIALDSINYPIPLNPDARIQADRELYIDEILRQELPGGGWNLTAGANGIIGPEEKADPEVTGMALQALAKYTDRADVKRAAEEALTCLSAMQNSDGGYTSWGGDNMESTVQVIVALTELGVALDDPRFVKKGQTLLDNLLTYWQADAGFKHTLAGGGNSQMSTEQGFYALAAAQRAQSGKSSLYRMNDAEKRAGAPHTVTDAFGLSGRHPDVKQTQILAATPDKAFTDISAHKNKSVIEALASRGIISGMGDAAFAPDKTMTRAEFASIVVRSLGLTPQSGTVFTDIPSSAWHAGYISTAASYGIVSGVGNGRYDPEGTITRQEAAVMVTGAAKLCGMDNQLSSAAIRDILAQFSDYVDAADWAQGSLAFCYQQNILDQSDLEIMPMEAIKRGEIAQMLFNMLTQAKLL